MNQKVVANFACKIEDIDPNLEVSDLDFKKFTNQETDPKNLDQAIHNVLLGMELISVVENAYSEIEAALSQVKQWISPSVESNLDKPQKSDMKTNISLKLRALDQVAETFTHKGRKLLDGSISASVKTDSHSFLVVGANGSPENRINLNTSLNIPSINSQTLGLGELSVSSKQNGLKGLMILENALAIIHRLKQRSAALGNHLSGIKQHLATAIENHQAAKSAPDSYEQARDIIRVAADVFKKNKCEY